MFHIVFSADENYIPYTAVLIASIVQNTDTSKSFERLCKSSHIEDNNTIRNLKVESLSKRQEGYIFHILSDSVSGQTREKLERLEKSLNQTYPCTIQVHIMQEYDFKRFPKCGAAHSNYLPYYRLKMDAFLDREVEKCLYLDSDMLCLFDIRELFALDLSDKIVAAVGDCGTKHRKIKFVQKGQKKLHFFDENYFNSGFLLLNAKEYRKYAIENKCEELASCCTYITAADQDLLNATIPQDKVLKLPYAYNFQTICFCYCICKDENPNRLNYTRAEFTKSFKSPKILHFGEKPWKYLKSYLDSEGRNISALWWDYVAKTPAFGQELLASKENAQDYLMQAGLGAEALEYYKSLFGIFKIRSLIANPQEDLKVLQRANGIPDEAFGLCLIVGEMIFYARRRKRGAFSVLLKIHKVQKAFLKYHHLSRVQ